ncbi:hypothetical protein [Methyloversatilis thermotolerans]|uniref:hypothetical protein n=1 Tax=Methyloversatilis thermotolerans TaxID=1346290 RepID=UPI0012FA8BB2|nr:hypothetical protein [Methyloversatilis thermotolerans]
MAPDGRARRMPDAASGSRLRRADLGRDMRSEGRADAEQKMAARHRADLAVLLPAWQTIVSGAGEVRGRIAVNRIRGQ